MLAAVSMCIQFRSYLRGAKFTLRTDHKSLIWLHRFKYTEGMMARWLHTLQQFQFSIVHRAGNDHGNTDGLSRAPTSPCRQCTRVDCPQVDTSVVVADQPFDAVSVGDSEDADLIPLQSGEDWVAQLDDDLSRPASQSSEMFSMTTLQLEDPTCVTLLFLLGRRLSHCVRSCDCCGIMRIICQQIRMVFCGGSGVQKYIDYSYWYQNQDRWLPVLRPKVLHSYNCFYRVIFYVSLTCESSGLCIITWVHFGGAVSYPLSYLLKLWRAHTWFSAGMVDWATV